MRRIWFEPAALPQYYPLVHTTYWGEYRLWKLAPLGYHLVNILLHATSTVLLWRMLLHLRVPGAWLAAAIFSVHPVQVESVAWITERKNVLSLALALGSMLAYFRYSPPDLRVVAKTPGGQLRWYWLALSLFVAAMLSKTVVATLPAVLVVLYWWKRGRVRRQDVSPLTPFFVIGVGLGLITAWIEKYHVGAQGDEWALSFVERMLVAGRALWFYAGKVFWPHPLIFFYPRWNIDSRAWWQVLLSVAAVALVAGLFLARGRIGRGPLTAILIFAGVLFPALGFFNVYPFRYSFVADHFQYHATAALIAGSVAIPMTRWPRRAPIALAALLPILGAITAHHSLAFQDVESLWRDTIAKNPGLWVAHQRLGLFLEGTGRNEEALSEYREALALNSPDAPRVHVGIGYLLIKLGRKDEALSSYAEAIRLDPSLVSAHVAVGNWYFKAEKYDEAEAAYRRALVFDPADPPTLCGMGSALLGQSRWSEAKQYFTASINGYPAYADAHFGLALSLEQLGKPRDAMKEYETVLRLQPNRSPAADAIRRLSSAR